MAAVLLPAVSQSVHAQQIDAAAPADMPSPVVIVLDPVPDFDPAPFVYARSAYMPAEVKAMLEAAMKTDDTAAVAAVVKFAQQTQPFYKDEIKAMHRAYLDNRARLAVERTKAHVAAIRAASPLELWKGQIELGAFRNTGNTDSFGFSGALSLKRDGIRWEHQIKASADYAKNAGTVTQEQYAASYQPRFTLDKDRGLFAYGRLQYEKNELQGFRDRYSSSAGFGYRLLQSRTMSLSVEAGPAIRQTTYVDDHHGTTWSGLASLDFAWKINPSLKFTQTASSYFGSDNSTFTTLTGLEAGMFKRVKAKLSYSFEHETEPPAGALKTDTISRFSLVYGF